MHLIISKFRGTHHGINQYYHQALTAVSKLQSVQPEQSIAEWQKDFREYINMLNIPRDDYNGIMEYINDVPSVQPEITDEQAIGHLQASGWMQSHDKQMYEMGLKERLADDSDSYDALLPSSHPAINCSEIPNTSDVVSRKAVRNMVSAWAYDLMEQEDLNMALHDVDELPPEQPEVIHCKDCALWHRTGCPMNVFAEKPEPGYFCGTGRRKENE